MKRQKNVKLQDFQRTKVMSNRTCFFNKM